MLSILLRVLAIVSNFVALLYALLFIAVLSEIGYSWYFPAVFVLSIIALLAPFNIAILAFSALRWFPDYARIFSLAVNLACLVLMVWHIALVRQSLDSIERAAEIFLYAVWVSLTVCTLAHDLKRRGDQSTSCPRCGYDLRGGLNRGCPECGWNRPENEGQAGGRG